MPGFPSLSLGSCIYSEFPESAFDVNAVYPLWGYKLPLDGSCTKVSNGPKATTLARRNNMSGLIDICRHLALQQLCVNGRDCTCAGANTATMLYNGFGTMIRETKPMAERFERHRQAWTQEEIQKLHLLVSKGMGLKAIAKALMRSEESTKSRAKLDKIKIRKAR